MDRCPECGGSIAPTKMDKMATIKKKSGEEFEVPIKNVFRCNSCMFISFELEKN